MSCPSFKDALLGPSGSAMNQSGTIVASDREVKDNGRMGAEYELATSPLVFRAGPDLRDADRA